MEPLSIFMERDMKESTVRNILSDPEFDPSRLLEPALLHYIKNYPKDVAEDKVTMKWLTRDHTVVNTIASSVDVNDVEMLTRFLHTLQHEDWRSREAIETLAKMLNTAEFDDISAVADIISGSIVVRKVGQMSSFIDKISQKYKIKMLNTAVEHGFASSWGAPEWKAMLDWNYPDVIKPFAIGITKKTVQISESLLQYLSAVFKRDNNRDFYAAEIFCSSLMERWPTSYVCFRCGLGAIPRRTRGGYADRPITSPSGFTLHRKSCDPNNEFPSPWELYYGSRRKLEYKCQHCKRACSSPSGKTLHEKSCPCRW